MRVAVLALTLSALLFSIANAAQAATVTVSALVTAKNFSASPFDPAPVDPVNAKFTITLDPNVTYFGETSGISVDFMNIGYNGPVTFYYQQGVIDIFGDTNVINLTGDDFYVRFRLFDFGVPVPQQMSYSKDGYMGGFYTDDVSASVAVTPIPGSLVMMATGVIGLAGLRFARRRVPATA